MAFSVRLKGEKRDILLTEEDLDALFDFSDDEGKEEEERLALSVLCLRFLKFIHLSLFLVLYSAFFSRTDSEASDAESVQSGSTHGR